MIYQAAEWKLREKLKEIGKIPDQFKKDSKAYMKWVFMLRGNWVPHFYLEWIIY